MDKNLVSIPMDMTETELTYNFAIPALKCLSKRDLEGDALHVQLFEVSNLQSACALYPSSDDTHPLQQATIHMSLPRHQNIVTLYQTLQTKKWLFLLLEMCPGEDLYVIEPNILSIRRY